MTDSNLKAALEASLYPDFILEPPSRGEAKVKWVRRYTTSGEPWPRPELFHYCSMPGGGRGYESDYFEGKKVGVTTVLKVLGLGTEGLIRWSANQERQAVLSAAEEVYAESEHDGGPAGFIAAVEERLGKARQHQKLLAKAADIGSEAHKAVQDWLQSTIDGKPEPSTSGMRDEALVALMGFQSWFQESGLKAVRCEQPVFSESFCGGIDVVCSHPRLGLGIVDLKTGKNLYDTHHVQVAAYLSAGRNFADLRWAKLIRLPKTLDDPNFEVRGLGDMYDGKTLTEGELMRAFNGALEAYNVLVARS
jgi:hypothetical protein